MNALMSNLLYFVAGILVILWAIGHFSYHTGEMIHVLFILAILAVIIRLIQTKRV